MTDIHSKSTFYRLLSDLEDLAGWKEDWEAQKRRAEICQHSSVGLSYERQDALLHEGKALQRAMYGVLKRILRKRGES
jgi:hypothetical protein